MPRKKPADSVAAPPVEPIAGTKPEDAPVTVVADASEIPAAAAVTATVDEVAPADAVSVAGDATQGDAPTLGASGPEAPEAPAVLSDDPPETPESKVGGSDAAGADPEPTAQGTPAVAFPLLVRVANQTRMPVQVPAVHLDLPASGEATIIIYSEGDLKTLHSDLNALFSLNGFREDAFTISPAETTEA